jgi:hypothetical protein
MYRVSDLLNSLSERGVTLWVGDGQIHYRAAKGVINPADIELLQEHGEEILALLKRPQSADTRSLAEQQRVFGDTLPLSFQQEWVWNWLKLNTSNCVITLALRLSGILNVECLRSSLTTLTQRHDSLRTTIVSVGGVARQKSGEPREFDLDVVDLGTPFESDAHETATRLIHALFNQPMDVAAGPLFTGRLYSLSSTEHVLAIAIHHLIADAISINRSLQELLTVYGDLIRGRDCTLPTNPPQYADYVRWQRRNYFERLAQNERFWDGRLDGAPALKLSVDSQPGGSPRRRNALMDIKLGQAVSVALHDLASRAGATVAMVALALYASLMFFWGKQTDIVVPFIVASRALPSHASVVGLLAHPLFMRIRISEAHTFAQLLELISQEFRSAYRHLDFGRMAGRRSDLFGCPTVQWLSERIDHTGGMAPSSENGGDCGLSIEPFPLGNDWLDSVKVEAPLGLEFWNAQEGICAQVFYRADLFGCHTMQRFSLILRSIAQAVARNSDASIASLRDEFS